MFDNPKVLILNVELELKAEKDNAEVRIKDVSDYQAFVDAEWRIIYEKLEEIDPSTLGVPGLRTLSFGDRIDVLWSNGAL